MNDLLLTNDYQDPTLAVLNCERATLKVAGQELEGYLPLDANVNKVVAMNLSQVSGLVGKSSQDVLDFWACNTGQSVAAQESDLLGNLPYVARLSGQRGKLPRICSPTFASAYWFSQAIKGNKLAQALIFVITAEKVNQAARVAFHLDETPKLSVSEMIMLGYQAIIREENTEKYLTDKPVTRYFIEKAKADIKVLPSGELIPVKEILERLGKTLDGKQHYKFYTGLARRCDENNIAYVKTGTEIYNKKGELKPAMCNHYDSSVLAWAGDLLVD